MLPDKVSCFQKVLGKLMAKDPAHRYQDTTELIADLERLSPRVEDYKNAQFPDDKTLELAKDICKSSKYAIYMSKQNFYAQVEMTEPQAYMFAKEMMAQQGVSVNAIEGFTAFIEKRDPVWNDDTF